MNYSVSVNLIFTVIFWMEIADVANDQNKKLVSVDVTINFFFFFFICHINNFHVRDKSID